MRRGIDGAAEADVALGPLGLVGRQVVIRRVRLRVNLVEATALRGLPVPYWLAPLMPWQCSSVELQLRTVGIEVDD